ncbi:hypothetical protein DRQ25_17395, partial [Candidatus Fermentibacteria bacterium]
RAYTVKVTKGGSGSGTINPDIPTSIDVSIFDPLRTDENVYPTGTQIVLTAVADAGSIFTDWGGTCNSGGANSSFSLLMNGDKSCTATFEEARTLTITTSGTGSGTVGGDGPHAIDSTAKASAIADVDSEFTGWSGDCGTGTTSPVNVVMDSHKTCNANFDKVYNLLTINTSGSGSGTVGGDGLHVIDSTAMATATAAADSVFTGWSGDCGTGTTSPVSMLMDSDKTCNANFDIAYTTLTITTIGNGSGTVDGAGTYVKSTTVQADATADTISSSIFAGWGGDCGTGTTTPISVLMDRNKDCTASFKLPGSLTVYLSGNGTGTVTSSDNFINCPAGDCSYIYALESPVTLTATPDEGFIFKGWKGNDITCPGTDPCTVTVTTDSYKDITATFQGSFSWDLFLPAITSPPPAAE